MMFTVKMSVIVRLLKFIAPLVILASLGLHGCKDEGMDMEDALSRINGSAAPTPATEPPSHFWLGPENVSECERRTQSSNQSVWLEQCGFAYQKIRCGILNLEGLPASKAEQDVIDMAWACREYLTCPSGERMETSFHFDIDTNQLSAGCCSVNVPGIEVLNISYFLTWSLELDYAFYCRALPSSQLQYIAQDTGGYLFENYGSGGGDTTPPDNNDDVNDSEPIDDDIPTDVPTDGSDTNDPDDGTSETSTTTTTTTSTSTGSEKCYDPADAYKETDGMKEWCMMHCNAEPPNCPSTHCQEITC